MQEAKALKRGQKLQSSWSKHHLIKEGSTVRGQAVLLASGHQFHQLLIPPHLLASLDEQSRNNTWSSRARGRWHTHGQPSGSRRVPWHGSRCCRRWGARGRRGSGGGGRRLPNWMEKELHLLGGDPSHGGLPLLPSSLSHPQPCWPAEREHKTRWGEEEIVRE